MTADGRIERGADGAPRYAWRAGVAPLGVDDEAKLVKSGRLKAEECLLTLRDVDSGKAVMSHGGSVCWNAYRRRWVMISGQKFGTSMLGELWYAEADTPVGPWVYARKVLTHDDYTFYNPTQHPYFDQQGGRLIYFEGTYVTTFSGNKCPTPRYDYNQIMYRLDLADPRLVLPVPIYATADRFAARAGGRPAFFACDRPAPGLVPLRVREGRLTTENAGGEPLCWAWPADGRGAPSCCIGIGPRGEAGGDAARVWPNPSALSFPAAPG
jgi:hypothetical protein